MKAASFKEKVLQVVRNIPKGKTMTYGAVAKRAGNANAARAVGAYMKNNYDPTVPCQESFARGAVVTVVLVSH